jgi:LmbE family N-acetylglucosaminyl deacetylase
VFRKIFCSLALLAIAQTPLFAGDTPLSFSATDRLLVVAPHPDDEALGLSGALQSAKAAGASVKIVYLTNGESNEVAALFYQKRPLLLRSDFLKSGMTRRAEALDAMGFLGFVPEDLLFFGYPDGGLINIWLKYWGASKPYRSMLTRFQSVPYKDNYSYGRAYKGDEVVHDFEKVLLAVSPTHVFVTAPFDLNQDHQAAFLYLQVALFDIGEQLKPPPAVHLYVVHAHRWPDPKSLAPGLPMTVPQNIDWDEKVTWQKQPLTVAQVVKKEAALLRYKSQVAYKKNFLLSFVRTNELLTEYPPGRLLPEAVKEGTVSNEEVHYRVLGKELWVDVPMSNALDEMGVLSCYLFSYRKGFLFSEMPKLTFKLFGNKLFVYDRYHPVYDPSLVYKLDSHRLFLRVPLAYLKDPDYLFVSTRNAKEEISLDFGTWKVLEIVKTP